MAMMPETPAVGGALGSPFAPARARPWYQLLARGWHAGGARGQSAPLVLTSSRSPESFRRHETVSESPKIISDYRISGRAFVGNARDDSAKLGRILRG